MTARRLTVALLAALCSASLLTACTAARPVGSTAGSTASSNAGTSPSTSTTAVTGTPPAMLLGRFVDDYRGRPEITADRWVQDANTVYLPVEWNVDGQYLIARNADDNLTAPGAWTRIDWMPLDDMAPYRWAYCLTAYDAPTRDSAERTSAANRATPRTGCNGFPFSRMQRRDRQ